MKKKLSLAVSAALASAYLLPGVAHADEAATQQCIDANEAAQSARKAEKLHDARANLLICVAASCPGLVRDDCAQRLEEVERAQPTIVFEARSAAGHDIVAVIITVDGRPFTSKLDGSALPIDPGEHVVTFEAGDFPPMTQRYVLHEGEKGRRERVVFGAPPQPAPSQTGAPSAPPASAAPTGETVPVTRSPSPFQGQRLTGIILGAAGLVTVTIGAILGTNASSSWSSARAECGSPTSCPNYNQAVADHDSATSAATLSTIGFLTGAALLAGGAALYFTAPTESPNRITTGVRVAPTMSQAGGGMTLVGRFW
jgi:hypothetical protein